MQDLCYLREDKWYTWILMQEYIIDNILFHLSEGQNYP